MSIDRMLSNERRATIINNELMFSSKSNEWATPQDLFDKLNAVYHFNLDPASTNENAKCEKHFTENENGLAKSWGGAYGFL